MKLLVIINFVTIFVPVLLSVAFLTLIERKVMGAVQNRRGPNVVGITGLLQPIADGIKLIIKEPIVPRKVDVFLFVLAPLLTFCLSIIGWCLIPFSEVEPFTSFSISMLILLGISSLGVYGIILAGWSSNSKYAFMGGLRSAAQLISYEVSFSLSILPIVVITQSLNLTENVLAQQKCWFLVPLFPIAGIFLISALAETNRTPFDLPEAEGELVAGFNVEYSGFAFALFFLAEYANIILVSVIFVLLFMGGWLGPFGFVSGVFVLSFKVCCVLYWFVWVRASLPRYRYDQLMKIGWTVLLPFTFGYFIYVSGLVFVINRWSILMTEYFFL